MSVILAFAGGVRRRSNRRATSAHDLFSRLDDQPAPVAAQGWWPVPGLLAASPCPGGADGATARGDLARLAAAGVRHLVDLTEPHEHPSYHALLPALSLSLTRPVAWERHPIAEGRVPGITQLNHILDRLDALIAVEAAPCVHGLEGCGRTVLVCACWRVRHGEAPGQAIAEVVRAWQGARQNGRPSTGPLTLEQRRFVQDWPRADRLRAGRCADGHAA